MLKTDIKKIESEDVKELSDEALDRTTWSAATGVCAGTGTFNSQPSE